MSHGPPRSKNRHPNEPPPDSPNLPRRPRIHHAQFKVNSEFTLLHYSQYERTGSGSEDSAKALEGWDEVYNGDTTCQERIKSKMAHPFRLAELARAAVTRGSGRKLLESSQGSSSYSGEPWVEEIELFGLDGGDGALFIPAPLESNAHSSSRSVDRRKLIVGSNSTVYDINGQTVTVDTDMAGTSFTDDGSGLIDITQSNTKDAYTGKFFLFSYGHFD